MFRQIQVADNNEVDIIDLSVTENIYKSQTIRPHIVEVGVSNAFYKTKYDFTAAISTFNGQLNTIYKDLNAKFSIIFFKQKTDLVTYLNLILLNGVNVNSPQHEAVMNKFHLYGGSYHLANSCSEERFELNFIIFSESYLQSLKPSHKALQLLTKTETLDKVNEKRILTLFSRQSNSENFKRSIEDITWNTIMQACMIKTEKIVNKSSPPPPGYVLFSNHPYPDVHMEPDRYKLTSPNNKFVGL